MNAFLRSLPSPWMRGGLTVFLILAACLPYLPVVHFKFSMIDDGQNIFANPYLNDPRAQNMGYLWTHSYYSLYAPVTSTLWAWCARLVPLSPPQSPFLDCPPSPLNPAVFHTTNLILHVANVLLVFALFQRLNFDALPSSAGALLWGLHPVQVQSVAWITGGNNVLAGTFGLLALLLYFRGQARSTRGLLFAATASFVFALLSKPSAIVLPLFVALIEGVYFNKPLRRWLPLVSCWLLLSLADAVVTARAQPPGVVWAWSPWWGRPFVVGDALSFYLAKLFGPISLTFDYARNPYAVLTHVWGYVTWVLPVLLFALLLRRGGRFSVAPTLRRPLLAGFLIFVAGALPALGIVPTYAQDASTVADRYLYLALFGPALVLAALLSLPGITRFGMAICGVALGLLMVQSAHCVSVWRDSETLTADMLRRSPDSVIAHRSEAFLDSARGDLVGALGEYQTMARLQRHQNAQTEFYVGKTLADLDRQSEAVPPLRRAFTLYPEDKEYWYALWNILAFLKRYDEAQAVARQRLTIVPNDTQAQFILGKTLVAQQKPAEALPFLLSAERRGPQESVVPFYIGIAYERMGRIADALYAYRRALALDPGRAQIAAAISRLSHTP